MDASHFARLPDELLQAVVFYLPPADTLAFGATCKRGNKTTYDDLVWRRHCLQAWRYWEARHELAERRECPPAQTKWRLLFNERTRIDTMALETFDTLLLTQQLRITRIESITGMGYDVKDLFVSVRDNTTDEAEDVLARRYYANVVLGQIHRATALEKWTRLQNRQMVRLEEVLGAYDLFTLSGRHDLADIDNELDRIAAAVRSSHCDFELMNTRTQAVEIAKYLHSQALVGNESEEDYHALRNNFISLALFGENHSSLPLQSVAIYCAVARRLGVNAKPSNYPHHVHAVIEAPQRMTLDGHPLPSGADPDTMHMDPWRSDEEVPREQLTLRLRQMGAPIALVPQLLGSTSNLEIAIRTSRNIMNSVQEARDRRRGQPRHPAHPEPENAWYAMLWSMLLLADSSDTALARRRQCLPFLLENFSSQFPEDLHLVERYITPLFANIPEASFEYNLLIKLIPNGWRADQFPKAPSPRARDCKVAYSIGTHFQHKRYGYEGFIIGWDVKCAQEPVWIQSNRVDELPRGADQPFYNTVANDKSVRYVAEENIQVLTKKPCEVLMGMAGRWFKRWDAMDNARFVSNVRDEYPDD